MRQPDIAVDEKSFAVRTAMDQRSGHALQKRRIDLLSAR